MNDIKAFDTLPKIVRNGNIEFYSLPLKIEVAGGSFLHIGGTKTPLSVYEAAIFQVDGQPVIPGSSFKGAFRQQAELLFIKKRDDLARALGLAGRDAELLKPSIPAPRPSKAEEDLFDKGYRREHSEIKVKDDRVQVDRNGICPVCYFFGAAGLEGYLRIPNFFPGPGEWRIDQTRIRIDRQSQTAAPGAIVTGEQVKPGSIFNGELLVFTERHGTPFGRCRQIGGVKLDLWLDKWAESDDTRRQLFLFNEVLMPALNNITVLGGQKSFGGGRVQITVS